MKRLRFSSFLTTSLIILVTGSVLLISVSLYFYFQRSLTHAFHDKLQAQKGQTELILDKRLAQVQRRLKDLSLDNTIRVTMMLGVAAQLEERLKQSYSPENGTSFLVESRTTADFYPRAASSVDPELDELSSVQGMEEGDIEKKPTNDGRAWIFATPIMRRTEQLGMALAIYDWTRDEELAGMLRQTLETDNDLALRLPSGFISVKSGRRLLVSSPDFDGASSALPEGFVPCGREFIVSPLPGFPEIYFFSSLQNFQQEKKRVSLLIGFFSFLVMIFSGSIGIFLGSQMSRPLRDLAQKAMQISEAKKESLFEQKSVYLEINQLAQAFNKMITSLAEEKARYAELLKHIDDAVYIFDLQGRIVEANETTYSLLGYPPKDLLGESAAIFLPEQDIAFLLDRLTTQEPPYARLTIQTVHLTRAGSHLPVEINARAITYGGQEVVLNVARDLTSRMEAERALRESEERYRSILENIEETYFEIDFEGRITFFNPAFLQLLGWPTDELQNLPHHQLARSDSAKQLEAAIDSIQKTGAPARLSQYHIIRQDGENRILDLSLSLIENAARQPLGIRGVGRDVTEQLRMAEDKHKLELQLQKSLRLEALGTLAGGIAHDFNNILAAILGYTDLTILRSRKDSEIYEFLQGIRKAGIRGKDLVAQILAFSRQSETKRRPVDIAPIVKETIKMLTPSLPDQIELRSQIQTGSGDLIYADPTQIHQVLMNLCVNAKDAMRSEGGILEITLKKTALRAGQLNRLPRLATGSYLQLSIVDTGEGMDEETIEHIFEPFYTTKKPNEGTGMGLAVVHGIISHHEGEITVSSAPGKGTRFDLYFPLLESTTQADEAPEDSLTFQNGCRVLFIDDEEALVHTGVHLLTHLGCRAEGKTSSREALKVFRAHPDSFDLVITDHIMPELSGLELAQKMLALRPEIPIILLTGYSEAVTPEKAFEKGLRRLVLKPVTLKELSEMIQEIMSTERIKPA